MHDARTGFHDIKPLPDFSPFPLWQAVLILSAVLLLALLVWYYRRRSTAAQLPPPEPPPPDAVALLEIRRLTQLRSAKEIVLRELATRLSVAVRKFLESSFRFPATDQTPGEVCSSLPLNLKAALPTIPKERLEELHAQVGSVLRFCENAAFSPGAERYYPLESDTPGSQLKQSEDLIRQLAFWLRKEGERTTGVVAQSKLAKKTQPKNNTPLSGGAGGV